MAGESELERKGCGHAVLFGYWTKKITAPDRNGDPDRLFLRRGHYTWIEIKDFGETPNAQQLLAHERLRKHGASVFWVDTMEDFCRALHIPVPRWWKGPRRETSRVITPVFEPSDPAWDL